MMNNENKHNITVDYLLNICGFKMDITKHSNYTVIDCGNGKRFFVGRYNGRLYYGYELDNSHDYSDQYSHRRMKQILGN